uniref:Vacuole membrane protein 1 n=1 Tax=Plectus sambesii TaxID=2011161 RepID=A0A914VUJ7_9BILA
MGKRKGAKSPVIDGGDTKFTNGGHGESTSADLTANKHVSFDSQSAGRLLKKPKPPGSNGSSQHMNGGEYYQAPSGRGMRPSPSVGTLDRLARQKIVLWRQPFTTVKYCLLEAIYMSLEGMRSLWRHKLAVLTVLILTGLSWFAYHTPGAHQKMIEYVEKKLFWCLYWVGLGILSSVGFGTGLHTFLLYLGPHIASVTLAAYECGSVKFPEPPYPDQIICPDVVNSSNSWKGAESGMESSMIEGLAKTTAVTLWAIISKVRLESFMWGAGTALGELPPYFMARAARLSGQEPDDEEYREFLAFVEGDQPAELGLVDRIKQSLETFVANVGFPGILLCASVPNPFFDLAGITCGHFLVPFWTFFGATLLGKAAIKMHIQMLFVVIAFSEHHVELVVGLLRYIPMVGKKLQAPFKEYLRQQKEKLHHKPGEAIATKGNLVQDVLGYLVLAMVVYFLLSIINSLAQAYHKRLCEKERLKKAN